MTEAMTEVHTAGMMTEHPSVEVSTATPAAPIVPRIHTTTDVPHILTSTAAHTTYNASLSEAKHDPFIGGFITLFLLILIGVVVLVLAAKTRRKGSYRTNEKGNDEESDAALQAED